MLSFIDNNDYRYEVLVPSYRLRPAPDLLAKFIDAMLIVGLATTTYVLVTRIAGVAAGKDWSAVTAHRDLAYNRLDPLSDDVTVRQETVTVVVEVDEPTRSDHALAGGRDLLVVGFFLLGLWLLRGLVGSARDGDPFVEANVRRLRLIGYLLLVGGSAGVITVGLIESAIAERAGLFAGGLAVTLHSEVLVAGLAMFVLAHVFAQGVRLREDVEGTV